MLLLQADAYPRQPWSFNANRLFHTLIRERSRLAHRRVDNGVFTRIRQWGIRHRTLLDPELSLSLCGQHRNYTPARRPPMHRRLSTQLLQTNAV
jgi:hypothetical protein